MTQQPEDERIAEALTSVLVEYNANAQGQSASEDGEWFAGELAARGLRIVDAAAISVPSAQPRLPELDDELVEVMSDAFEHATATGLTGWSAFVAAYEAGQKLRANPTVSVPADVWSEIERVEREIRFCACSTAGDHQRNSDMRQFSMWAGILQQALAAARTVEAGS